MDILERILAENPLKFENDMGYVEYRYMNFEDFQINGTDNPKLYQKAKNGYIWKR